MRPRRIAFVPGKAVFRKLSVVFPHDLVASDFGQNAGGGDGVTFGIAFDQRGLPSLNSFYRQAVDKDVIGLLFQLFQCPNHALMRCFQNVPRVNFRRLHRNDGAMNPSLPRQPMRKCFAFFLRQRFGIIEIAELLRHLTANPRDGQNYRRNHYRPRQRAASRFVDSGNALIARRN